MSSKYRVNFGNGQVHYAGNRAECERFLTELNDEHAFLQFKENGEWFKCRAKTSR